MINHSLRTLIYFSLLVLCLSACGKDDVMPEQQSEMRIDTSLVGLWTGTVTGSFGEADMMMDLRIDGKMAAEGSTTLYCPIDGTWHVKSDKFIARGNDDCDGTLVTFTAPVAERKLVGNWSGSTGNSGKFEVVKL